MKKFICRVMSVSMLFSCAGFCGINSVYAEETSTGEACITVKANGDVTNVDTSELTSGGNVTSYLVTTAKDGQLVKQYETEVSDAVEVDSSNAEDIEIVPVYEYSDLGSCTGGVTLSDSFEDGLYNITITNDTTSHIDLYVNGYMAANNIDQNGEGRSVSTGSTYTAPDVRVEGGSITLKTADTAGGGLSYAKIVKSPGIVDRKTKIYITGDSLVCRYYGGNEGAYLGTTQTGWGQVLYNFIDTDKYEIVNLANAGHYAVNLYQTAVPGIIYNSEEGDIFLFESGVNDMWHPYDVAYLDQNRAAMAEAVTNAVNDAKEAGIDIVLINPNSFADDCTGEICIGQEMLDVAEEKGVGSIDLSGMSGTFLTNVYNGETSLIKANFGLKKDNIHSSYLGAMKYASFVANDLYNLGYTDMINTDFDYTRTDTQGNTIVCKALIENPVLAGAVFAETPDQIIEKSEDVLTYPVSLRIVDTAGNVISGENADIKWTISGSDTENVTLTGNGTEAELVIKADSGSYKITAEITYLGETITREYSFAVTVPGEGMLIDSGFESGLVTDDSSTWSFTGGIGWNGCGTASVSDKAYSGSYSGYANSGALGQKVTLTAETEYSLTVKLYSDAANTTGSAIGFYDGTQQWPMNYPVQTEALTFTSDETGKWITYTTTFTPSATKEYLVGLWAAEGTGIYIDDVVLKEYDGEDEDDSIVAMTQVEYEVNEKFKNTDAKGFIYSFDVAENETVTPIFYLRNEENGYKKLAEGVTVSGGSVNLGLIIYNIPAQLGNVWAGIGFEVGTSSDDTEEPTTENNVDLIEKQMKNANSGININQFDVSGSSFSF